MLSDSLSYLLILLCFDFPRIKLIIHIPTHRRAVNRGNRNIYYPSNSQQAPGVLYISGKVWGHCSSCLIRWDSTVWDSGSLSTMVAHLHSMLVSWPAQVFLSWVIWMQVLQCYSLTSVQARCSGGAPGFCSVLPLATGPCCSTHTRRHQWFCDM
jgi:hypothetical protein